MTDAIDLTGQCAIVTGGTRGIGAAIAEKLLQCGAEVVVCARKQPEALPAADGRSASFVSCDVREPEQVAGVVEAAVSRHGRVDMLINNAGGAPPAASAEASARFNERIVALNLLAPISFAQAVYPAMSTQETGGVIVNIASVSGMRANPMGVAYGAAKAGLLNATETLANEWAPKIRVVAVTSGLVLTDDARAFYGDDASVAKVAETIPLGRLGDPSDIADACLFLVSPMARWMTGSNLIIDGGPETPAYLKASDEL